MNTANRLTSFLRRLRYGVMGCALALALPVSAQVSPTPSAPSAPAITAQQPAPARPAGRSLVAGRDYMVLAQPMPAPSDRLEVSYFFWYNSPTSAKVDPLIRQWAATKASPLVVLRPLPAVLENNWGYGARIFFALQQLNREQVLGPRLMQAMASDIVDYNSPQSLGAWLRDQGLPIKSFQAAINDPGVIAKTSWMPSLMRPYGVERVPTVVIDGRFLFVASPDEKPEAFVSRVDFASQVLTQRKLQEMARQRKNQKEDLK